MARKKAEDSKVVVGNITGVNGEVSIAGGDIYKGYTTEQVSVLLRNKQYTTLCANVAIVMGKKL